MVAMRTPPSPISARRSASPPELGNGDDLGAALTNLGDALSMLGRVDEALATLEAGLEEMRSAGLALSYGAYMEANLAKCELHLGRWRDARERLERLLDGPVHADMERLTLLGHRITLEAREGRFEAAAGYEREAQTLFDANVWAQSVVIASCALAELALLRGDPAAARSIVAETRRRFVWGDLVDWPALLALGVRAEADLAIEARACDQEELAAAARATAVELLGAGDVPGSLKWYRFEEPVEAPAPPETLAHRLVGDGELAGSTPTRGPTCGSRPRRAWEALRFPYPAAYARFRQAEAILAAGGARVEPRGCDRRPRMPRACSSAPHPCATRSRRSPAAPACRSPPTMAMRRRSGRSASPSAS